MVGHRGSSAGSYLADRTSPFPSHCASIVVTSTVRVKFPKPANLQSVIGVTEVKDFCAKEMTKQVLTSFVPCVLSGKKDGYLHSVLWHV